MGSTEAPPPGRADFDTRVEGIASLGEPVRRALYRYVVARASPVSRDEACAGVGVARHTAKFHLDKLVDDGLLEVEFRRPPGRGGPGAGRPAKLYRRAAAEVEVSLPERRYDLAGRVLARAVHDAGRQRIEVAEALRQAAQETGRALGREARRCLGARPGQKALTAAGCRALAEVGYEPRLEGGEVSLANCPFHALAADYTELVCTMNRNLLEGVLDGLGHTGLTARLEPEAGMCCVKLRRRSKPGSGGRR
ncbi:MAG: helix-turn-helix transcriptional regulator [Acidimicrobiales bacterium]